MRRWKFVYQFWTTEKGTKVSLEAGGMSLAETPKLEAKLKKFSSIRWPNCLLSLAVDCNKGDIGDY